VLRTILVVKPDTGNLGYWINMRAKFIHCGRLYNLGALRNNLKYSESAQNPANFCSLLRLPSMIFYLCLPGPADPFYAGRSSIAAIVACCLISRDQIYARTPIIVFHWLPPPACTHMQQLLEIIHVSRQQLSFHPVCILYMIDLTLCCSPQLSSTI
jgi:hypothetical protein